MLNWIRKIDERAHCAVAANAGFFNPCFSSHMARKPKAYTSKTTESTSPAKVLTLVEKNLVQHFLKHLVGVDESSYKSLAVHHGFSTHAHAR